MWRAGKALAGKTAEAHANHTGYSSVGRASDCRSLQVSDGPWFDSGWPDFSMSVTYLSEKSAKQAKAA